MADDGIVQLRELQLFLATAVAGGLGANGRSLGSGGALDLEEGE